MSKRHISALLLSISLMFFAEGCKKKGPAPPPPPAPKAAPAPEPPKPKPAAPIIASLTADPSSIQRGQSSLLRWSSRNVTAATIDNGVGSVDANGSRSVSPSSTTTYTLRVSGPGGSASQSVTVRVTDPPPPPPPPAVAKPSFSERVAREIQDVFFNYDKNDIREDARATLQRNADALKAIFRDFNSGTVSVEGHCDERGSAEYNLGLGDRRSTSARDFLVQLGVPGDRLKTVSYGKERPQCTESNEACWQKNRRAHFGAQ
ncbi:MAG: OmpA family protein [Candidatus Solibacter usitatus]|nr:OmpA family protein [Candidatus Solibacter usitatus]